MTAKSQERPKPPVCRRLFADEDDDEPREVGENRENRFFENLHNQHAEQFIQRYNFDTRTETALEGNYEWYKKDNNGEWVKMPLQEQQLQLQQQQQQQQQPQPQQQERETEREEAVGEGENNVPVEEGEDARISQ